MAGMAVGNGVLGGVLALFGLLCVCGHPRFDALGVLEEAMGVASFGAATLTFAAAQSLLTQPCPTRAVSRQWGTAVILGAAVVGLYAQINYGGIPVDGSIQQPFVIAALFGMFVFAVFCVVAILLAVVIHWKVAHAKTA